MNFSLAIIGFGNVGQGLTEILMNKKKFLKNKYNFTYNIIAVADNEKGSVFRQEGLDPKLLLEAVSTSAGLNSYPDGIKGLGGMETIKKSSVNTVIEATPTNLRTGEPGTSHVRTALQLGKHVITTNKGPSALFHKELMALAAKNSALYGFEGTVMSGTPVFSVVEKGLAGCRISEISGIFNGTTNFILTNMENGSSYQESLLRAQKLGYAESDPAADVEGWDIATKLLILANVVMDANLSIADIAVEGITGITKDDVLKAKKEKKRWKLIGEIKNTGDQIHAAVSPQLLPLSEPLSQIMDINNAVTFQTDMLGPVTLIGAGAGRKETGFSILSDLLDMHHVTETH